MATKKTKKKNTITLLALFGAVVLLAVAYVLLIKHNDKKEAKEAEESETSYVLSNQEEDAFESISVEGSESDFELNYEGETWYLATDQEFPVDQTKAEAMADALESLSSEQLVIENPEDLSEYGLSEPGVTVTGTTTYGDTVTLIFGDQLPTDTGYYAMVNGDGKVYVVTSAIRGKYDYSLTDLLAVEDTPTIDDTLITGVKVASDTFTPFTLLYDEENEADYSGQNLYPWYLADVYMENVNADTTAVNDMLSNYTTYSFSSCVDYKKENLEQYGLASPKTALSVWYREEEGGDIKEYTLYVGNQDEDGNYYVRTEDSDRTYIMTASNVETKLSVEPFDLVSKYTQMLNIDTVDEIRATTKEGVYTYQIETTKTTDTDGNETEESKFYVNGTLHEDEQTFRNFYQSIIALSVDAVLPDAVEYMDDPVLTLEFDRNTGSINPYVVKYLPYNDSYYAVSVNGVVTYAIDMREVDDFITSLQEFE